MQLLYLSLTWVGVSTLEHSERVHFDGILRKSELRGAV